MASITSVPLQGAPNLIPGTGQWSAAHLKTPYGTYTVTTSYANVEGKVAVPIGGSQSVPGQVTSNLPTVDIVDLHLPFGRKILEWTVTRDRSKPLLPSFTTEDTNLVQLSSTYVFGDVRPLADGRNYAFSASGQYIFACKRPVTESTGFRMTFPPYEINPADQAEADHSLEEFVATDFAFDFIG